MLNPEGKYKIKTQYMFALHISMAHQIRTCVMQKSIMHHFEDPKFLCSPLPKAVITRIATLEINNETRVVIQQFYLVTQDNNITQYYNICSKDDYARHPF